METCKISNEYWLSRQPIVKPIAPLKMRDKVNHIWIYDRSGSMTYLLPDLAQDLIAHYKTVEIGDLISIGYFSGVGVFRFILKGFVKTDKVTCEEQFKKIILANCTPIGTTCFSEILSDASKIIEELTPLCSNFALMFFTDGYPVVPDYNFEIMAIFASIKRFHGRLSRSIFVGYGDRYNRELMSQMTLAAGGTLIHSSILPDFSEPMAAFVGGQVSPRWYVNVPDEIKDSLKWAFTVDPASNSITQYGIEDGHLSVDDSLSINDVWFITTRKPKETLMVAISDIEGPAYAAAMILSQQLQADAALEVMGRIGDVEIIDRLNSAFTNEEFGQTESQIKSCVFFADQRFQEGHRLGYVPRRDRFCILDLVEMLQDDPTAKFYPYHPAFEYKRTGAKTRAKDGYPKFVPNEANPGCNLDTLTWNDRRMNISIMARITGHIDLSDDCSAYGFSKQYPTWIYRNYTLVLDGVLNVRRLPVSCSATSFQILQANRVIPKQAIWSSDAVYVLDLKKVPVMNRAIADSAMSARDLCRNMIIERKLEATLKVLKWKRNELDPDKVVTTAPLSENQVKYLATQGITFNGFNPPKEELPPTDFYVAKEFEIKMLKFSSLPAVEKTLAKDPDRLTDVEKFIYESWQTVPEDIKKTKTTDDTRMKNLAVSMLDHLIASRKSQLRELRNDMSRTKASVILGKRWFSDLTAREGAEVSVEDNGTKYNFVFSMRDIRIDL